MTSAPENRPNPFANVTLPAENRKVAAEKVRLPFTEPDIRTLHQAIEAKENVRRMPEGRIPLAHATVYLATAPKSNSAYAALAEARTSSKPIFALFQEVPG